jgi:hypothetical protein
MFYVDNLPRLIQFLRERNMLNLELDTIELENKLQKHIFNDIIEYCAMVWLCIILGLTIGTLATLPLIYFFEGTF